MNRIVIIGGGISGHRLLIDLLSFKQAAYEITLIEQDNDFLATLSNSSTILDSTSPSSNGSNLIEANGVRILDKSKAVVVDRLNKIVYLDNDFQVPYDKLILGLGATPLFRGANHSLKTRVVDVNQKYDKSELLELVNTARTAAIVGGGIYGLDASIFLNSHGIKVQIFEENSALLYDETQAGILSDGATTALSQLLKRANIIVNTSTTVKEVVNRTRTSTTGTPLRTHAALKLSDGRTIDTDLAVIASKASFTNTIRFDPEINIDDRGYKIHNSCRLICDRDIYAIGGCASRDTNLSHDRASFYETSFSLARSLITGQENLAPRAATIRINSKDLSLAICSLTTPACDTKCDSNMLELNNNVKASYKGLRYDSKNRLQSGVLIGDTSGVGTLFHMMENWGLDPDPDELLFGTGVPELFTTQKMELNDKICMCNTVTLGEINEVLLQNHKVTESSKTKGDLLKKVAFTTRATTGCGSCVAQISAIIAEFTDASMASNESGQFHRVLVGSVPST